MNETNPPLRWLAQLGSLPFGSGFSSLMVSDTLLAPIFGEASHPCCFLMQLISCRLLPGSQPNQHFKLKLSRARSAQVSMEIRADAPSSSEPVERHLPGTARGGARGSLSIQQLRSPVCRCRPDAFGPGAATAPLFHS